MCLLEGRVVYGNLFLTNKIIIFQVTLSGNQEPVRVEITEAALGEGAEVSLFFCGSHVLLQSNFSLAKIVKNCI
jgi:hypothetical protein